MNFFVFYFFSIILSCYALELTFLTFDKTKPVRNLEVDCGIWSAWSCICCGGCSTQQCIRTCQPTNANGCGIKTCDGNATTIETTPCTSPSQTCKFPLPVCCEGQQAYVNKKARARWCKLKN
uniref:Uncharacterized protein n=1 Tax=Panagrolaimus sp. PS1159 TaxID=55785 RepID=A0AC35GT18_9BILA